MENEIKKRGPKKGTMPKTFLEFQRKGHEASRGKKPWNAGKKNAYSKETLEKMSKAKIGVITWIRGKHHNEETIEKCRIANLGKRFSPKTEYKKGDMANEKHWNWKDGISKMPGYDTFITMRRRARKKESGGSHTLEEWQELKKFHNYMCLCCKRFEPEIKLSEDHITPLIMGGSDSIDNIQPLCVNCNSKKHIKTIAYA